MENVSLQTPYKISTKGAELQVIEHNQGKE